MGSKKKKKTIVTKTLITNVIKLSYLQTLALTQGLLQTSDLEKEGFSKNISKSSSSSSTLENVVDPLGVLGIGKKKKSSSTVLESNGVKVKEQWLQPYFDRIRYTIGIRELSIAQYVFAERSELVSVPFGSPKEVIKVHIIVDEYIPSSFDSAVNWIKYYIKSEGSEEWIEVCPLNLPSRFNDTGEIIPKIVNFNLPKPAIVATENKYNYTPAPVQGLRFKAVLTRPTGDAYNAISPLIKSYRMIMTPRN